jgi:hypothetical protein
MNTAYVNSHDFLFFCAAKEQLNDMLEFLCSDLPLSDEHGAIEQYIQQQGHELLSVYFKVILISGRMRKLSKIMSSILKQSS